MTFDRKTYGDITDSILSRITKGFVSESHELTPERNKYRLNYPDVQDIVSVTGLTKGYRRTFDKGRDYALDGNAIEWLKGGEWPDIRSAFSVRYVIPAPGTITDVNPGSVVRTLVESIALEMDFIYAQMSQVYNAGYIDTATGRSLDLVVSILGMARKPAGFASGEVTFGRNSEPGSYDILKEAYLYDGRVGYELKNPMIKGVTRIEATVGGARTTMAAGKDYDLSGGSVLWLSTGRRPDAGSMFYVDYTAYEKIVIPGDMRISTYSRTPENIKVYRVAENTVLTPRGDGIWEVDAPVIALTPGRDGDVFAGSVNVMPVPVTGIEYVINKKDILNGTDQENDDELRERAKRALETVGKATIRSLKSAVQGVEGVTGKVVVIDRPDGVLGVTKIIASGGDEAEIGRVIENTRAAGIAVEFRRPKIVSLDIKLAIKVSDGADSNAVKSRVDSMVRKYADMIDIGENLLVSKIINAGVSVEGVADLFDVTVNDRKENVNIRPDEKGELRTLEIFTGG